MTVSIDTAVAHQVASMLASRAAVADGLAGQLTAIGGAFGVSSWTGPAAAIAASLSGELAATAASIDAVAASVAAADSWSMSGVLGQFVAWGQEQIEPIDPSDPGVAGAPHFVIGPPSRPHISWDEDFIYDSKNPGWGDYISRIEWQAKLRLAQVARGDLDDATQMYSHYWSNTGDPIVFDYEEAWREDAGVQASVASEIARAQMAAEQIAATGLNEFPMTGDASSASQYPQTENWQKAIGGHQLWSSADVRVAGNTIEMDITVHAEDYYNFNRSQTDIATGAPDDENGRFTEIGWARPFPSSGELTRTVVWEVGAIDEFEIVESGEPQRNPGREDDELERQDGDADRNADRVPANDRSTGAPRAIS